MANCKQEHKWFRESLEENFQCIGFVLDIWKNLSPIKIERVYKIHRNSNVFNKNFKEIYTIRSVFDYEIILRNYKGEEFW